MTSANQMSNFGFLEEHDPLFVQLAFSAERAFASDPNTTLIKLRQLGEALAQHLVALEGIYFDDQTSQADLLYQNAALAVVVNKPREQLKEIKPTMILPLASSVISVVLPLASHWYYLNKG